MADIDSEVVFNTLIVEGLDVPTAYAASINEPRPAPRTASRSNRHYYDLGLIAGLVLYVAWQLW